MPVLGGIRFGRSFLTRGEAEDYRNRNVDASVKVLIVEIRDQFAVLTEADATAISELLSGTRPPGWIAGSLDGPRYIDKQV